MGFLTVTEIVAEVRSGLGNHDIEQLAISGAAENDGRDRVYRFINMTMLEVAQLRLTNGTLYRHRELEETNTQFIVGNAPNTTTTFPSRAYATNPVDLTSLAGFSVPGITTPTIPHMNATSTPTLGIISIRIHDFDDYSNGWRLDPVRDRDEFEHRTRRPGQPRWYGVFMPVSQDWYTGGSPIFSDTAGAILLSPPPVDTYHGWTLEVRRYRYPRLVLSSLARTRIVAYGMAGALLTFATNLQTASELTADSVLDFGPQWDEVVIAGAVARAFKALNLNTLADGAQLDFQRLSMDVAKRHQLDAEDLDFGPPIEVPTYQVR